MEYTLFIVGGLIIVGSIFIKIFNIKFNGIELHKVNPKRVTIVEKTFGDYPNGQTDGVRKVILNPGLHLMIKISPFYVVKYANLPMFKFSIEPLAGMEEDWSNWEDKPRHPISELDWDTVSGIELEGGSMTLVEFILVFSIVDPIAFLYNNDNSVQTMVAVAKAIIRDSLSSLSFSGAMQISTEKQLRIFNRIKDAIEKLEIGIELELPENGTLIKNLYPCPETKKGRALRFDAKQKGKAKHELAKGDRKADREYGKGLGKRIKKAAEILGLPNERLLDYDQQKVTVEGLSDKTTVLSGGGNDSMNSMASRLAGAATATAIAINKNDQKSQQPKDSGQEPDNTGGDEK